MPFDESARLVAGEARRFEEERRACTDRNDESRGDANQAFFHLSLSWMRNARGGAAGKKKETEKLRNAIDRITTSRYFVELNLVDRGGVGIFKRLIPRSNCIEDVRGNSKTYAATPRRTMIRTGMRAMSERVDAETRGCVVAWLRDFMVASDNQRKHHRDLYTI